MKKNWKDYLTDLCDNLPAVGIDSSKFQEAMKRLPVEPFTSETYSKLSNRAKYGVSEIGVGLTILDRDLRTIRNAGKVCKDWEGLAQEIDDVMFPLYRKAWKHFNTWEKKGYPHR